MLTYPFKLVTIIAEPVLEPRITQELRKLGASGFTVVEGRGQGSRALHAAEPNAHVVSRACVYPRDRALARSLVPAQEQSGIRGTGNLP
jgi:nitrogen regulatory protein PII